MTKLDEIIASLPPLGEDDPAYLVLADWLQAQGDPWGDLIMLQHRGMHEHADALLRLRGNDMLGDIYRNPKHELVWHLGFLRRATLRTSAEKPAVLAAVRALAKLPCARKLDELVLDPRPDTFATTRDWQQSRHNIEDPWPDWDDLGPLLLRELPVPRLAFGAWPAKPEHAYVAMPSLDMIGRWFHEAHLRSLRITGSWPERSEALRLDGLVELALHFAHGDERALSVVTASKLPSLERLTVSLGGGARCVLDEIYSPDDDGGYPDTYSADDLGNLDIHGVSGGRISNDALRSLLEALPPTLRDLSFTSSALGEPLLDALAWHPRVAQLRSLDLSACTITDRSVRRLVDRAAALSQIGSIDLTRNTFSEATRNAITRALPNAVLGESQQYPDFFMRYVATME